MSGDVSLLVEVDSPIAWLTLNRPAVLNALDRELFDQLDAAIDRVEADATIRAVVLGAAGRAFCAGADLAFVEGLAGESRDAATMNFLRRATGVMTRLERLRCPVIAAVQGIATAGGMELVLCCDLVVAADCARFGDGHANYGLLPGAGASVRLPRKIGANRANRLFFTGELADAQAMHVAGLVNEVVAPDRLHDVAAMLAETIARKSPVGIATMKRLAAASLDAALTAELDANLAHLDTTDRAEGLAAFAAGRVPVFTGR